MKLELDHINGSFEYLLRLEVPAASDLVDRDPLHNSLSELTITKAFMMALISAYEDDQWTDSEYITIEWDD